MDPISLSLGIIPLIGGSIKMYRASQSRLRAFRHYSREIDRVRKQFERQRQFFLNEVHLSLRLVVDDEALVEEMVDDGEHPKWQSRSLEDAMVDRFHANNCRVLNEIVDDIGKTINSVQEGLECFDCLEEARHKNEPIKDAVKRLRDRMKIAFDKSKFDQWVTELRSSNNDLKLLREQASDLGKPKATTAAIANIATTSTTNPCNAIRCSGRQRLPPEFSSYSATRRASQALYDALWAAWSTQDAAHFRHLVKLFLETKTDEGVQLNLVISCLGQDLLAPGIVKVHVKSQILDWMAEKTLSSVNTGREEPTQKRRRVVTFADDENSDTEKNQISPKRKVPAKPSLPEPPATVDLRCSQHICSELLPRRSIPRKQHPSSPVGYLEDTCSHERFRHSFFQCCEGVCNPALCSGPGTMMSGTAPSPIRLDSILAQPRSGELSVPHQLQLALRIASAVLKFNSTSWLGEYWGLQDLYFFERDADLPASLQTLHLGVEWARDMKPSSGGALMMDVDSSAAMAGALEDAKLVHGIHNATMYNLGVALLSIGRWSPVDPNDVLQVRRIALQSCPLGPRFQEMTQRVLECDFGYGKDLKKPKLQEAVYDGVLLELESMISALSVDE
ncbi:hypothetical protein B0H63DRAFT_507537 [Podospora didyma]|uniref:Uncharacterized protein n=1 Tax=Podospora didyma TaxID=330526 RepID=A0AAE0U4F2_9PEZI|nr:hypothetical protein B0H63DRAFT_507537 [Podospora didyma]